jgi:hypothetical protein
LVAIILIAKQPLLPDQLLQDLRKSDPGSSLISKEQ